MNANVWARLGMDPNDRSTWTRLRTNMPGHRKFDPADFAPRAWAAICELCGGEDRVDPASREWRDSLIVNLGDEKHGGKPVPPQDLPEWHVVCETLALSLSLVLLRHSVLPECFHREMRSDITGQDGDFFVHYLDSREQALLVTPLFTDIVSNGGATIICPEAIPKIAKHLHEHPEGVSPRMVPRGQEGFQVGQHKDLSFFCNVAKSCDNFVEATGKVGDVYLMHPLMLHAPSSNALRRVRIIINPAVSLKEEHCFDREDGNYSLVEQFTLKALGKERLPGWKATGPRETVVPARLQMQEQMKQEELKRLAALKAKEEQKTVSATA
jgi:hypothetical protein